jgi:hypothetical protein
MQRDLERRRIAVAALAITDHNCSVLLYMASTACQAGLFLVIPRFTARLKVFGSGRLPCSVKLNRSSWLRFSSRVPAYRHHHRCHLKCSPASHTLRLMFQNGSGDGRTLLRTSPTRAECGNLHRWTRMLHNAAKQQSSQLTPSLCCSSPPVGLQKHSIWANCVPLRGRMRSAGQARLLT